MRKFLHGIALVCAGLAVSCGNDDDQMPNVAPDPVTGIQTNVVDGATLEISWNAAEDANGDEVTYSVSLNNLEIASKISETSLVYDATDLVSKLGQNLSKGFQAGVTITIKAFDTDDMVSKDAVVSQNLLFNRAPSDFQFGDVEFINTFPNSELRVNWYPAFDEDRDVLSYDVYINDKIVTLDYVIGSNDVVGTTIIDKRFAAYLEKEFTIKIVANDRTGGETEITKDFNFAATDVEVGSTTTPYSETFNFSLLQTEIDREIDYHFEITKTAGLEIVDVTNNYGVNFKLFDEFNNEIAAEYNQLSVVSIDPGKYTLKLIDNDSKPNLNGSFRLVIEDIDISDRDVDTTTLPLDDTFTFDTSKKDDGAIRYNFTITEEAFYYFDSIDDSFNQGVYLYNADGTLINSSTYWEITGYIEPGTYYIEVKTHQNADRGVGTLIFRLN